MTPRRLRIASCGMMLAAALLSLPSCTQMVLQSRIFQGDNVNLLETNYGAADMLAHASQGNLKPGAPVHIGMLTDLYPPQAEEEDTRGSALSVLMGRAEPEKPKVKTYLPPAPFGKVIPGQIGARLQQLGFNVIGTTGPTDVAGDAIITGTYARASGKVMVNLRLVETASGRILASYDYNIPISGQVADLLGTDERGSHWFDL